MPGRKDSQPIAFFHLTPEDFDDLDATAERMMRMIEDRSRGRRDAGDGRHGGRARGSRGPLPIPLADADPDPPRGPAGEESTAGPHPLPIIDPKVGD